MSQCVTVQCYRLVEAVKSTCNLSRFQYLSFVHHIHVVRMLVWKPCIESTLCFYQPAVTYNGHKTLCAAVILLILVFCNPEILEQTFVHSYVQVM